MGREKTVDERLKGMLDSSLTKFVDTEKVGNSFLKSTPPLDKSFPEISLDEIEEILGSTIAEDRTTKLITAYTNILTYTKQEQTGILFQAASSTGKSYIAIEVTKGYFPEEDIISKGYVSPTAFFHQQTELCLRTPNNKFLPILSKRQYVDKQLQQWDKEHPKPRERGDKTEHSQKRNTAKAMFKEEWEEADKYSYWDISRKIFLFKDMPHDLVLQNLRPLISKDDPDGIFEADITDKSTSGQLATKNVILHGCATFLFCSAKYSLDGQELTRFFLLNPDVDQEKIRKSLDMTIDRVCNFPRFRTRIEQDEARTGFQERIRAARDAHIDYVVIPDELKTAIKERIKENHEYLPARLLRDAPRLVALMKGHAMYNFSQRKLENGKLTANATDVETGFQLYKKIAAANERGVPPQILEFHDEVLEPTIRANQEEDDIEGIPRKEFRTLWADKYHEQIGYNRMETILRLMENAGLIYEETDPNNRNRYLIHLSGGGVSSKKNIQESLAKDENDTPPTQEPVISVTSVTDEEEP